MSKYQEAIDYLKGGNLFGELSNDALGNIEELVDRATPMKLFLLVAHKNQRNVDINVLDVEMLVWYVMHHLNETKTDIVIIAGKN